MCSARHTETVQGDSGAPVFIRSADQARHRALGFHFLHDQGIGFAVDASAFFAEALDALPGSGCEFF
jgi:hypothetical protein